MLTNNISTFLSTEGEEADWPGGTGENNNYGFILKNSVLKKNSDSFKGVNRFQWKPHLLDFCFIIVKVRETKFSKQEIRKMYRGFKQERQTNKNGKTYSHIYM